MSERAKQKMISIYPIDEATLIQIGKDQGLSTFSATLRWILRDWKRMKTDQAEAIAKHLAREAAQ